MRFYSTWDVVITLVGGAKWQSAEDTTLEWYLRPKSSKPTFYKNKLNFCNMDYKDSIFRQPYEAKGWKKMQISEFEGPI